MSFDYIQEPDCKGSPERRDVEFKTFDGITLRGWFYPASGNLEKSPAIVITHGWGCVKEMDLDVVASEFQKAGLCSLVKQAGDYYDAISYLTTLPEVDTTRIAVWGYSLAGGHAAKVASIDRRVKAVVTVAPMLSSVKVLNRMMLRPTRAQVDAQLIADRQNQINGGEAATMVVTSADPAVPSFAQTPDAQEWSFNLQKGKAPMWENKYTAQSTFHLFNYNPEGHVQAISPTPWLVVQGDDDNMCAPDVVLGVFQQASEPKELALHKGGHFSFFEKRVFSKSMETQIEFLKRRLEF